MNFLTYKNEKILISPHHYNSLINYRINIHKGYPNIIIKNKTYRLSRYIMINLLNINVPKDHVVDHINSNKLDNRDENLRILSFSDNSKNRLKSNCSSVYYGVSKKSNKWVACIKNKKHYLRAEYTNELHAAYQYNIWLSRYNIKAYKPNIIQAPDDFVEYQYTPKKFDTPKGIKKIGNLYRVAININKKRRYYTCYNLDEAIKLKKGIDDVKKNHIELIKELKIKMCKLKNKDGNYIFMLKDKEIIIDKDTYPLMYMHSWYISSNYVVCNLGRLSRILMNCTNSDLIVDHINGNTYDNRKCNLRIVTSSQNAMNKSARKRCTSKYIGVTLAKGGKKWNASIYVDNVRKDLGTFKREQDAALVRDKATKKYFKEFGKLNFPERPKWSEYWMNIAETVKERSPDYYKVGAVLVRLKDNRLIVSGYNGLPSGISEESIDWSDREIVHNTIIHAEMNVLLYSNSMFDSSILYTTTSPCLQCLKLLSAANIKKIIYKHKYKDIDKVIKLSKILGIELIEYINVR